MTRTTARKGTPIQAAASAIGLAIGSAAMAQPFIGDISRWVAQDNLSPRPTGAVLFIGSSSIRRWEQLALDFADYEIIQRGFGGAQFEHVNLYVNDIVLPYNPSAIVVWAGTNDNTSGEPGAEVFADYQQFVAAVHAAQPGVQIFYLGITPTPTNTPFETERELANSLIAAEAATDTRLHYIDLPATFDALNPPSGPNFTALYVDGVHLNRAGYDLWTSVIRPEVQAIVAPNKALAANPLTPQPGTSVFFDFGPSNPDDGNPTLGPDTNGNHWNNWHSADGGVAINAGEHLGGLVDESGNATGMELVITGGFLSNGLQNGGLTSPTPALLGDLAVATATQDYFFCTADDLVGAGNDDVPGGFMLRGLDSASVYDLRFFASRNAGGTSRITEYRVTGANEGVATLVTSGTNIGADGVYDGNDDEIAEVTGIRPDAFGQVFIDLTLIQGGFAYLNAMELRVVQVAISGQPTDLIVDAGGTLTFTAQVEGLSGTGTLHWERDGVALTNGNGVTGATTETLTITSAGRDDVGLYRLVATDGGNTVASAPAIGGVRLSPLGLVDFNNDGSIDALDVFDFLVDFEMAE